MRESKLTKLAKMLEQPYRAWEATDFVTGYRDSKNPGYRAALKDLNSMTRDGLLQKTSFPATNQSAFVLRINSDEVKKAKEMLEMLPTRM